MSDFTAIAGVSRTLRTLLLDRMTQPVAVTLAPPDATIPAADGARINLFLYRIAENAFLKNQEIPGHGHPAAYGNPPLSLDLYYLVTPFARSLDTVDSDLNAQTILGDAMRVLHDYPIVTEELEIRRAAAGVVGDPVLDLALQDEFERVKIVLHPVDFDELSKIWASLPEANLRLSVVYMVSVVQIEQRVGRRIGPPVQVRRIFASTRFRPEILEAYRTPPPPPPVEPIGDTRVRPLEEITIHGRNIVADRVWVRFGTLEPIRVLPEAAGRIRIVVPDDQYPIDLDHPVARPIPPEQRLQPGALLVQVVTEHDIEGVGGGLDPGVAVSAPRRFVSNQAVLQLVPRITGVIPAAGTAGGLLTVNGTRLYAPGMSSFVMLGDLSIPVRVPRPTDPWAAPTPTSVQVPLAAAALELPPPPALGQLYDVRIQVNGARNREDGASFTLMP